MEGVGGANLCLRKLLSVCRLPSSDSCTWTWGKVRINMIKSDYNDVFSGTHWLVLLLTHLNIRIQHIPEGEWRVLLLTWLSTVYQLSVALSCHLHVKYHLTWSCRDLFLSRIHWSYKWHISSLAPSIWQGRVMLIFATTVYVGFPVLTVALNIIKSTH